MTWFHAPAISPEQGAVALIAIACISMLVWFVAKMLTYRESEDPHQEAHGDVPHQPRRERNG